MTKLIAVTAVLSMLGGPRPMRAQGPDASASIVIGTVRLHLGMTKAEAFDALLRVYNLNPMDATGAEYVITTKTGPPFAFAGQVSFDAQGVLERVARDWSPDEVVATASAIEKLYAALETITDVDADGLSMFPTANPPVTEVRGALLNVVLTQSSATKRIEMWSSSARGHTVSLDIVQVPSLNGGTPTISISEELGTGRK